MTEKFGRGQTRNVDVELIGQSMQDGGFQMSTKSWAVAVLMDIRDELQKLNRVMQCPNVQRGFRAMERLDRRLAKEVKLRGKR